MKLIELKPHFRSVAICREPHSGEEECFLCSRPVDVAKPHHRIEVVEGGSCAVVEVSDAERPLVEADGGYMGCPVVGSACMKRLPTGTAFPCGAIDSLGE